MNKLKMSKENLELMVETEKKALIEFKETYQIADEQVNEYWKKKPFFKSFNEAKDHLLEDIYFSGDDFIEK